MSNTENSGTDVLVALVLIPVNLIFGAFVFMKLWNWHVVPVFHAPMATIGHSVGLSALWGLLRVDVTKPTKEGKLSTFSITMLLIYAFALLIGWLAT